MTVATYALGTPRAAASRGGDCRAYDLGLSEGGGFGSYAEQYAGEPAVIVEAPRNVHGPHRFASTTRCQISNGMLRLTVGGAGTAPTLTVEAWRGRVTVGDVYTDVYSDLYDGSTSTPEWLAMGTLTIDSPSVSALLTSVRIAHINAEGVTLRLIAPAIADAYVTLRRGERVARIQHGTARPPFVDIDRRIRWTASPSPVGTASAGRVEETSASTEGFLRFVAAIDTVTTNEGAFSLTAPSATTARFGAGIGTYARHDNPAAYHQQLCDASRQRIVVS